MSLWLLACATCALAAPGALPPDTEKQLRALLAAPQLNDAHVGVSVVALGTAAGAQAFPAQPYPDKAQPVLFAVDDQKRFMPASNMKLYTAAIALRVLGPDGVLPTRVLATAPIVGGVLTGDLRLVGGGDPSLSTADLRELAHAVAARGVKRVTGCIIGDGSWFEAETFGGRYPDGWTLDDALWYYGPEISALAIDRNQTDVVITGTVSGQPARVEMEPVIPGLTVRANVATVQPGLSQDEAEASIKLDRAGPENVLGGVLTIRGHVAPGQKVVQGIAIPTPVRTALTRFRDALQDMGIQVEYGCAFSPRARREWEIARHDSPPLRALLRRLLKNSDNLYAEMLLRAAARQSAGEGSAERAHALLSQWLKEAGMEANNLRFEDGSGLSRYNLLTPHATTRLLAAVEHLPGADAFWDALPIAGVDGTLRNRMQNTPASDNARAKTGTFSIASTLSGYVTTRDGHRLAVSVMTNFVPDGTAARRMQDAVFATLATARWDANEKQE